MKRIILLLCTLELCSCANFNKTYPSVKEECEVAGPNSRQCHIYNLKDYTELEKEGSLATLYLFGAGNVPYDYEKAYYWFSKLAKLNNAEAENSLGIIYFLGLGRDKNIKKAEYYYLKAIDGGEKREAKINLAELYRLNGDNGYLGDYDKSEKWYLEGVKENPYRAYDGLSKLFFPKKNIKSLMSMH